MLFFQFIARLRPVELLRVSKVARPSVTAAAVPYCKFPLFILRKLIMHSSTTKIAVPEEFMQQ